MLRTLKLKLQVSKNQAQILERLSYVSTKVWNTANYDRRSKWEETGHIPNYATQCVSLKTNYWYKMLHSQSAQGILQKLEFSYQSWYALRKKDPKARPPGYRPKMSLSTVFFKKAGFRVEANKLRLSLSKQLRADLGLTDQFLWLRFKSYQTLEGTPRTLEIKKVGKDWYAYLVELLGDYQTVLPAQPKVLAIDQGIINLASCIDSEGNTLIYSGKGLLSIQRYFNKQIKTVQHRVQSRAKQHAWTPGLSALYHKRGVQTTQALHALTNDIVNYCLDQGIELIVLGKLTHIRKNKNTGKKTNQKLHAWSFQKFSQLLTYKAEAVGIQIKTVSERNSSKTCSCCGRKGNRAKRGLFICENKQCSEYGKKQNADLNGARNILNKYLRGVSRGSEMLVGSLADPRVSRWNYHTWASHTWQLRNQVTPLMSNSKAGNIPFVESSCFSWRSMSKS